MNHFFTLLTALLLAPLAAVDAAEAPKPKPNIIVILADDLGWADLSCYGSTFHESPKLDTLADQGMRFTQAYSSSPYCSPSRAAIMTGRHPARGGYKSVPLQPAAPQGRGAPKNTVWVDGADTAIILVHPAVAAAATCRACVQRPEGHRP